MNAALFCEGEALKRYGERLDGFVSELATRSPPTVGLLARLTASAYLLAVQLNEDNGRAALPSWEEHQLRPAVLWLLEALRSAALHGGVSAAAVTKIETFARGAARTYDGDGDDLDALDADSFLNWNLCVFEKIKALVGTTTVAPQTVVDAISRAIIKTKTLLSETPAATLCGFVWQSVVAVSTATTADSVLSAQRSFAHCSLLLQELIAENDRAKLTACDPYLSNSFEAVRHAFQQASMALFNPAQRRALGDSIIRAATSWQRSYPLLYAKGPKQQTPTVLLLKNERILKRMVALLVPAKPTIGTQVIDALLACAAEVSKRQQPPPQPLPVEAEHPEYLLIADIAASIN